MRRHPVFVPVRSCVVKSETARLLRAVLRLVEDDVKAVADSVVEIDEREAAHYRMHEDRLRLLEDVLVIERQFSRKVPS